MILHRKRHVIFVCLFLFSDEWKTNQYVGQFVGYSSSVSGVFVTVRLNSETDLITRLIILAFRLLDILLIPFCKNRFTDFSLIRKIAHSKIAHSKNSPFKNSPFKNSPLVTTSLPDSRTDLFSNKMFCRKWSYSDTKSNRISDKLCSITYASSRGILYIPVCIQMGFRNLWPLMTSMVVKSKFYSGFPILVNLNPENSRQLMTKNIIKSSDESFLTKFPSLEYKKYLKKYVNLFVKNK